MPDKRPLYSPGPEWANELNRNGCDSLKEWFDAFILQVESEREKAVANGADPAQSENDALSVCSQVAGFATLSVAELLSIKKNVPITVAIPLASLDVGRRVLSSLDGVLRERKANAK